jgi:uncharacterized DUF497 family protein
LDVCGEEGRLKAEGFRVRGAWKQQVSPEEVGEVLLVGNPRYRKIQKGHVPRESLYAASGRTLAGRYLGVFFVYKLTHEALIISARDRDAKERRLSRLKFVAVIGRHGMSGQVGPARVRL